MGYSLPPDDVTYRAFFSARSQRETGEEQVRCTVVNKDTANPDWYAPEELKTRIFASGSPANAAREVFGDHMAPVIRIATRTASNAAGRSE